MGFYWVYLHRNTGHIGKAHQSLSSSNDQTIDNIQRTMRAYSESGSDRQRVSKGHKTLGKQTHFIFGSLSFKLRVLAKQVSQDFMDSFSGLITPGNSSFLAQGCTHLWHCFRLKSGRGSKAAKRLAALQSSCRQIEDSGYVMPRGEDPSPPFSIAPQVLL